LCALSERAAALANVLLEFDHASLEDVDNRLPWTRDYDMETFAELGRLTARLEAVREALAAGQRRGGPRPFDELAQAVSWLREIYERCGACSPIRRGKRQITTGYLIRLLGNSFLPSLKYAIRSFARDLNPKLIPVVSCLPLGCETRKHPPSSCASSPTASTGSVSSCRS
jgi:hypothetical protein